MYLYLLRALRPAILGLILILSLFSCAVVARVLGAAEVLNTVDDIIRSAEPKQSTPVSPVIPEAIVSWTEGDGLWLNGVPGADRLRLVPEGTTVTLICYTTGPNVTGSRAFATTIWNYVRMPEGDIGYMSDAYLDTGSDGAGVPSC